MVIILAGEKYFAIIMLMFLYRNYMGNRHLYVKNRINLLLEH